MKVCPKCKTAKNIVKTTTIKVCKVLATQLNLAGKNNRAVVSVGEQLPLVFSFVPENAEDCNGR